jgi:hypothetical protein
MKRMTERADPSVTIPVSSREVVGSSLGWGADYANYEIS